MALVHDIVRQAGTLHAKRGHAIDRKEEKEDIKKHFLKIGLKEKHIVDSLLAIAPECLSVARGVWWLTFIHPTKLCIYPDRVIFVRRFLWLQRFFRCERAVMIRHIREIECDLGIFSTNIIFRTHRCIDVFHARKLYKNHARKATRIVQALIHEELNHGSVPSGDDFT